MGDLSFSKRTDHSDEQETRHRRAGARTRGTQSRNEQEKTSETENPFFEEINEIDKSLDRMINKKRRQFINKGMREMTSLKIPQILKQGNGVNNFVPINLTAHEGA